MRRILHSLIVILLILCFFPFSSAFSYSSGDRRDPFVPLVGGPEAQFEGGVLGIRGPADVSFDGVLSSVHGGFMAVINGEILEEGEKVGVVKVISVTSNELKLEINEDVFEFLLYDVEN